MVSFEFEVDYMLDDAGVETFYAWRTEDFDNNGVPKTGSYTGVGETPHEAISNLCLSLVKAGDDKPVCADRPTSVFDSPFSVWDNTTDDEYNNMDGG